MDVFDNFLHEVCDQFDNMVISGNFNLPDILWDSIDSASGVNELAFTENLYDHLARARVHSLYYGTARSLPPPPLPPPPPGEQNAHILICFVVFVSYFRFFFLCMLTPDSIQLKLLMQRGSASRR